MAPYATALTAPTYSTAIDGDSRDLKFIGDDSVSLIVTSPPYWNKADYGEGEANLGNDRPVPDVL